MAIVDSIEIDRSPEGVVAPIDDLNRHGVWQDQIVSTRVETDGPIRVGTRMTNTRPMPGGARDITFEIKGDDPPRRVASRSGARTGRYGRSGL